MEAEQLLGAWAVVDQPVERGEERRARRERFPERIAVPVPSARCALDGHRHDLTFIDQVP